MLTTEVVALLSELLNDFHANTDARSASLPFGGINVILFGDFHQFPPVGNPTAALYYCHQKCDRGTLGRNIYEQFIVVVELAEQMRVTDARWDTVLKHLRDGACDADDLRIVKRLLVTDPECDLPDFTTNPWRDVILVTPRHGVRVQWNSAAVMKHCIQSGERLLVSVAEDSVNNPRVRPSLSQRITIAGMVTKNTGMLDAEIELAVGMAVMVLMNISTEVDLANGTRGTIVDIILDPRDQFTQMDKETGITTLCYPPAMVLFKPLHETTIHLPGLPAGVIPLFPVEASFHIHDERGVTTKVTRRQYPITPGYAFTDFKSQGQTIEKVIIDLAKPPIGAINPFNAYVALSRGRGQNSIRLLRDFDTALFTEHPSEELRVEDKRLHQLDVETKEKYEKGEYHFRVQVVG